ncbi:MAG TPA: hypothetical protein ENH82_19100 [bacterium]|nr:hypothetical protein [bacterium]
MNTLLGKSWGRDVTIRNIWIVERGEGEHFLTGECLSPEGWDDCLYDFFDSEAEARSAATLQIEKDEVDRIEWEIEKEK